MTVTRVLAAGVCLLVVGLAMAVADEASSPAQDPSLRLDFSGGPYCGIYSLYAALQLHGITVDFEKLVDKKYVGSYRGSSLAELQRAAGDCGAYAVPMEGLSAASLRAATDPIILHVRRPGYGHPYGHWIVFLGVEGSRARILDPPNPPQHLPFAELLAIWDGSGLVVSRAPVSSWRLRLANWLEYGVISGFCFVGIALLALLVGHWRWAEYRLVRFGWLAGSGVVLALVFHLVSSEGFFSNSHALAQVQVVHFRPRLQTVTVKQVAESLSRSDVTLIDARYPQVFRGGHLPGAINLPIYAGLPDRSRILAGVPRTHQVIVYCQSDRCGWGEQIAADLYFRGYRRIYLFPGGWAAWEEYLQRAAVDE